MQVLVSLAWFVSSLAIIYFSREWRYVIGKTANMGYVAAGIIIANAILSAKLIG